ncbi:hypothetical protein BJ875DRAFT_522011, partial [Amylocarpus encephaloides]
NSLLIILLTLCCRTAPWLWRHRRDFGSIFFVIIEDKFRRFPVLINPCSNMKSRSSLLFSLHYILIVITRPFLP